MTPDQRARFDDMVARKLARTPSSDVLCAYCEKFMVNFESANAPSPENLHATGAVPVPNFGWFCCHACADAYEHDYGIRFQRDGTARVAYH